MRSEFENRRRERPEDFFDENGSVWMKLTREAAIAVCKMAASRGFVVARIEGGIWRAPSFEARGDSIWDGADPPLSAETAEANNLLGALHIEREQPGYDAFIVTAPPITGWPHKENA